MEQAATSPFVLWENFYVIVGSSGAALTGLQFVVIALIAESRTRPTSREISAFGTPTIVHFCGVLLISAILSAPWPNISAAAILLGICGLLGVIYSLIIIKRTRRQTGYRPVFEDWLFFVILPQIAYASLLLSAITLRSYPYKALFVIGGVALLLLFVGIHNAWDAVIYITLERIQPPNAERDQDG